MLLLFTLVISSIFLYDSNISGVTLYTQNTNAANILNYFEPMSACPVYEDFQAELIDGFWKAEEEKDGAGSNWLLGPKAVSAGSLHCDIWRGKAADLVNHDAIAVHPAPGWWKSHLGKGRQADSGRYALVLSIAADGVDIDLYAEASAVLIEKENRILVG